MIKIEIAINQYKYEIFLKIDHIRTTTSGASETRNSVEIR
jgi:hypothetical protein